MSIKNSYAESPENDEMIVDGEGGVVKYNNKFTCLVSIVNFFLDDTVDGEIRVSKASKSIGESCFIWEDNNPPFIIKVKLNNAILNL